MIAHSCASSVATVAGGASCTEPILGIFCSAASTSSSVASNGISVEVCFALIWQSWQFVLVLSNVSGMIHHAMPVSPGLRFVVTFCTEGVCHGSRLHSIKYFVMGSPPSIAGMSH